MANTVTPDKFTCFAIAIIYAVLGGMWTFFSDNLFAILLNQSDPSHHTVAVSHWMFVVFSAILLYWMLRVWQIGISHSQQSLHNANRALHSISECTKAITRITDETELMQEVCRTFVEVGGYRFAWVGFGVHDEEKSLRPVAHWGYQDGFIDTMNASWEDCERGRGPAGTTIRTGKTTTFQDLSTNPDYRPWLAKAQQCGYASGISLPLRDTAGAFGALVIFSDQPHAFDDEEVQRMEELAADLSYGINTIRMNTERKQVVEERMMLATVIEQASDGVLIIDEDGVVKYLNSAFGKIFGIAIEPAIEQCLYDLDNCNLNELFCFELLKTIFSDQEQAANFISQRGGKQSEINVRISPVLSQNKEAQRYVAIVRDVSNESQLERQLRQAQKLEAIATLSGGIAHDFNNILAVIISNTEMGLDDLAESDPLRPHLDIVLKAGIRGKKLVKQILTLSHPADIERKRIMVGPIVEECLNLLRASLPTTIDVESSVTAGESMVHADPTQIHQVIMNLCTNAADAMRDNGGRLSVEVSNLQIDPLAIRNSPDLRPGDYLELKVRDTGHGMGAGHMERIFDPFFTSKEQGKGTGLGLSVVHGIIKSHGGTISVSSEPGQGTEFRVLFPRVAGQKDASGNSQTDERQGGNERILFVDDERDYVIGQQKMLERSGYQVTAGIDSREILGVFRDRPDDFDLVITDQTMPHLTGEMLAKEMLKLRPDIPIILCSGSAIDSIGLSPERARAIGIREILLKPVDRKELHRTVRRLLDEAFSGTQRGNNAEYPDYR